MEIPQFETLAQSLLPTLQSLEEKRKELKKKGSTTGLWTGGILLAIGVAVSLYFNVALIGIGAATVLALIAFYGCVNFKSGELSVYYKAQVVTPVLKAFCKNAQFSPEQGIDVSEFTNSCLFTSPDRYYSEDLIEGRIGKTDFCCAEVHAEKKKKRTNSKGQTSHYWVDIFKGFIFIADFHKDFQGHTTVQRNVLIKIDFSGSRVKLENPDFEKKFDVYSTDQVEARYLLSPSMMERVLALEQELGKSITISFQFSNILIAIPESRNHFEASIWKPATNLDLLKKDFSMIHALISIVEELNLNTRIWGKE